MSAPSIQIRDRLIGEGHPAYIVAEMSGNHGHSFEQAVQIVRAAHAAGADAIKLQTYTADTLTIASDRPEFRISGGLWHDRTLYALYNEAFTPWDWQPKLKQLADDLGLHFFSTPFDDSATDFLESLEVPAHKIASFELVDTELLRKVGSTGKPVILSTGLATVEEIGDAVGTLRAAGAAGVALLKCTSAYPAPARDMNLRTIPDLSRRFSVPAGLSDHTLGITVPVAAAALGACIIEKHFTLSRSLPGPDSAFSLEPDEFAEMVSAIRVTEAALGSVSYELTDSEQDSRVFRRSLFVVQDMESGELFTRENVRSIRPGNGLAPKHLETVLGQKALRSIARGTPLTWELVG